MRRLLLVLALVACVAPAARAQYFGQNRVQYRHLPFSILETAHFDIYYYDDAREAVLDAARMAERAYARLSRVLGHRYRERQPIILFASHSEFQQNNVTDVGDATGGVTDAFRHRIMMPLTGSYEDFERVLMHEMVHQFHYDIFARGRIGASIPRLIAVQPPLWLTEGMAEYLSAGPVTPITAMWLRNAAIEGHLPTIEQMTNDPRVFPYRYGHALMAYIGERWGDEVIGEILHNVATHGVAQGFRRALGLTLEQLTDEWHFHVRRTYLPQIAEQETARMVGRPALVTRRTRARMHLSPVVAPDGRRVAYFSEGGSFFIDLYVAETETGRVLGHLVKSAFSADFESLRYVNSAGAWSADGRFFAMAAKHGGQDDLVIFDMDRLREHRRLRVPVQAIQTPSWSPDGTQLVFTGIQGGLSDLYVINTDGTNLRHLTSDWHADLHPAWSPDGRTIAFITDRGAQADRATLRVPTSRLAFLDVASGRIDVLDHMPGRSINPQWAPDSRSVAFISDRTGVPNLFLFDRDNGESYQLTNLFTGIAGLSELSPAISWAHEADRLVFSVYEGDDFGYAVYTMDNPRGRKGTPWQDPAPTVAQAPTPDITVASQNETPRSYYRTAEGFRRSAAAPSRAADQPQPVSVTDLLDSAVMALPDTASFGYRPYAGTLRPDYIAQPSIGYARDNFGRGLFGGTAIALSDMLGNRRMLIAGQLNGRLDEAQVLFAYGNASRRANWTVGIEQYPLFFFSGSALGVDSAGTPIVVYLLDRYVIRNAFVQVDRPFNRFRRVELGLRAVNVGRARQELIQFYEPATGYVYGGQVITTGLGHENYLQPTVALVFDNSIPYYVGPLWGRRSRLEYSPAIGDWTYHQVLGDYRRYDRLGGPFVIATRGLFYGRFGRDSELFPLFLGNTELMRGYTSGSFRRNECVDAAVDGSFTGCAALDQMIGSRLAVVNAELRFPLFQNVVLGFLPVWFPPIEGAVFYDAGLIWRDDVDVVWRRDAAANPDLVRQPLSSWGFSARVNLLGFTVLRFDYTNPLSRPKDWYWTISLGPTF
jgi:Tol biopolymer transport system component